MVTTSKSDALAKRVQELEREKEELRLKLWRQNRKPSRIAEYAFLLLGGSALIFCIVYSSSLLALIGLGLTFWGALLYYIRPARYVKSELLDAATFSSLSNIDKLMADLNYHGKGIYMAPRVLKELKTALVFVPSTDATSIPSAEEIIEETVILENPKGLRLVPPGLALASLLEAELGKDLTTANLDHLEGELAKVLIEDLQIAEDFQMQTNEKTIHVKVKRPVFKDLCNEVRKLQNICSGIGCPLCSSIACLLARVTDKPIQIEKIEHSQTEDAFEVYYRIVDSEKMAKD